MYTLQPTLLIVDDDEAVRRLLRVAFESDGWTVAEAGDGWVGMEIAKTLSPDLILLDVMMPFCDGLTALGHLKGEPSTESIPVVMVSAKLESSDRLYAERLGCAGWVAKPFEPLDLLRLSRRFCPAR